MASAKAGVHVVQLKQIFVPQTLQDGNKFIKWDDDSGVGTPVTLRVDKKGFFLYWTDQNKETEFLEISSIRDTRTGKYARLPRGEGKLKDSVSMGSNEIPLEDKTVTVVYGPDFVNVNFINFCCHSKEIAQEWTDELLKMAYNLLALNASVYTFLEKAHTKMLLMTDREGRLPIKNTVKMFATHKDDKKRVEKALELCGLPTGKTDTISPDKFTMNVFFTFYQHLVGRTEVNKIFEQLSTTDSNASNKKKLMTIDNLVEFLNKEQRDPRLNEILYPYANRSRGRDIIEQYEPNKSIAQKGLLSMEGFLRYLMSEDNAIVSPEKFDLNSDMDQPLSHYFINSSHNTYLTGHQLTGKSSVEVYRQCLLAGCRCIELDCWNGRNSDEEPIITHGYTVVTEIPLKEVLEAIAESAFKTSDYPVILSFENHCSPRQQAKMAMYCRKIFGDMLITEPIPSHPLKPGVPLPSPNLLLRKIIIKNKKKHHIRNRKLRYQQMMAEEQQQQLDFNAAVVQLPPTPERRPTLTASNSDESSQNDNEDASQLNGSEEISPHAAKNVSCDIDELDSDSSLEEEEAPPPEEQIEVQGTASKESEAGAEMSALVIYVQPVRLHTFEYAERRDRSFEVSSFVETQGTSLLKERPVEFVNFNKRQLSRIYPKGTRVDSSNYMPQVFWNAGCQMVALNFQTLDLGMQLNLGIFEYNGRNGYLLKPDFMRRHDRKFDPFTESTVDGIIAGTVTIKIISGQFLSDKRVGTFVEVDMYGLPADTVRRKRTKTIPANGINPVYDEEPFVFKKVVLPDLACLRIAAFEEGYKFIGTRILPVVGLRPGYRHISLRNESGQPLSMPTLFVHITVKDYVPDGFSELAEALANPIAYQSMVEKHAKQLLALTDEIDDFSITNIHSETPCKLTVNISPEHKIVSRKHTYDEEKTNKSSIAGNRDSSDLNVGATANRHTDNINGNFQKTQNIIPNSPLHRSNASPLLRQDTLNKRLNQSIRSLSDDGALEKNTSLLESTEANIIAESLDKIKEHKVVQKVMTKIERDLTTLRKKFDKLKEKKRELVQQEEDKLTQAQEKQKSAWVKSHSKLTKKSSSSDGPSRTRRQSLQFPFSMPSYRHLLKRRSEVDFQSVLNEHQTKLEELHKNYSQTMLRLNQEQYKTELDLFEKHHEQVCSAIEKAMHLSQSAQIQYLQGLHDQEVSSLMKRLESQTKDEFTNLSKKHKDKNELARIKRELQQKLIEQAVSERQRFSSLLEKRRTELEARHEEVKKKFEEEKILILERRRKEYEEKCQTLIMQFESNPTMFTSGLATASGSIGHIHSHDSSTAL